MKLLLTAVLSLLIMGAIFSRIDLREFQSYLSHLHVGIFVIALFFFIPQIALSAYRWQVMVRKRVRLDFWPSAKLILAANALNILLPSRVGDLSKAYFAGRETSLDFKRGMNVVLFEKYLDLVALGVVILTGVFAGREWDRLSLVGLLFSTAMIGLFPVLCFINLAKSTEFQIFQSHALLKKLRNLLLDAQVYLNEIKEKPQELVFLVGLSILLWFVHLLQFFLIFQAFHSQIPLFQVFRLVPLAILVGLIPVTLAGVGTRDSAMIYAFAPYESPALIAGVGLFASLRYFIPGILGLPFLNQYILKTGR